jgi:hypothetical protein
LEAEVEEEEDKKSQEMIEKIEVPEESIVEINDDE